FLYFFFFFQAEDGIRDFHVTGVQTCALPIYLLEQHARPEGAEHAAQPAHHLAAAEDRALRAGVRRLRGEARERGEQRARTEGPRSEERRVGKECRSRGADVYLKQSKSVNEEK